MQSIALQRSGNPAWPMFYLYKVYFLVFLYNSCTIALHWFAAWLVVLLSLGKCRLHPLEQLSPNTDEIKQLNLDLIFAHVN